MDPASEQALARLIRSTRVAVLGTIHDGEPNLAMVAYAFAEDFSEFYIHPSACASPKPMMRAPTRATPK